ncbi:ABC transporter ATP-binding protein [Paraclostridium sordellii]|uniref:ABC transporter ATP-binding protein n=1 Tax=Paraclostridium sordellii TaxID=1505 RepID=UPI0022E3103C|nr:ABC transporter ATP-binding protein [Paeniclostridium sordellii]
MNLENNKDIESISVENLSYSYNDVKVFENLSIYIKSNEIVCMTGENGTGKSTLFNLLLGVLGEYKGKILINEDIDIKLLKREELLKIIGYCPQKPIIFNDTIKNNISMDKNLDEYLLREYIDSLKFMEDKEDNNLNMFLENSNCLSQGQTQKLNIIRALSTEKPILLFDEPTASLDNNSKELFFELIRKLKKNKIILIISHDDFIIKNSDTIIQLNG